ncbi:mitochondrial amidoxime reducing component 2-like [Harpegnathos saltator]|uniref:mitochondrial amidoxime reducing component 2-like n=1 Tax=Harpegnathos saltator TaxID=610380 RepID=UPI00058FCFBF|nr:mitochondrial amidoxime reducing component 2-like [Harpegnathos saltator]
MHKLSQLSKYSLWPSIFSSKNRNIVQEVHDPNWQKVGEIKKLYIYPMLDGGGVYTSKGNFTDMSGTSKCFSYRNHMFVAYNCKTNCIIQHYDNFMIRNVSVRILDNNQVMMMHYSRPDLTINLNIVMKSRKVIKCTVSLCHKFLCQVKALDCGTQAATWISRCLNDENVRLAYTMPNAYTQVSFWKKYNTHLSDRNITIPSTPLFTYSLMPFVPRGRLSNMLIKVMQEHANKSNIIINTNDLNNFIEWEWIKIGKIILRNIHPWKRLETNLDWQSMPTDMQARLIPLQCELYLPGQIQAGDPVYVKMSNKTE